MLMPDVNILVYAHRREDPDHDFYRAWLERLANGDEPFALSLLVVAAFVRVVTHPGFPPRPTPLSQALAVIDSIVAARGCILLGPDERHWTIMRSFCEAVSAKGKLVADAQHAAIAFEHGCTWVTRDTDFDLFRSRGLRVELLTP
jgi:toxin-antitoxin system PIN domain toxin